MQIITLLTTLALVKSGIAGYAIQDDYSSSKFFDMFDFFTDADPTNGFVKYVDQGTAQSSGLVNTSYNGVYIGVDSVNKATSGRNSVRLTSKASYNEGLVILDLAHMPGGACGTWPAFWTVGPAWPSNGEIDIIEGVNSQASNAMTLHTGPGCAIKSNAGAFTGKVETPNCDVHAAGQVNNAGCSISNKADTTSYGQGFNEVNGGVYAMELSSSAIKIWHFSRSNIPSDITSGNPKPSAWSTPTAMFSGGCDIPSTFKNQQLVFDVTFCGDWAGAVWSSDSTCSSKATTCTDYVANNPAAFADSYWQINSLKVYKADAAASDANPKPGVPAAESSSAPPPYVIPMPRSTFKTSAKPTPKHKPKQTTKYTPLAFEPVQTTPTPLPAAVEPAAAPAVPAQTPAPSSTSASPVPAASPAPLQFGWFGPDNNTPNDRDCHRFADDHVVYDAHVARHLRPQHRRRVAHSHADWRY